MCRSVITPGASVLLGRVLTDLRSALLREAGLPPDTPVIIGPVDFGDDDE